MEILYLLIPLSAGLVLLIIAIFGWALHRGQFDDLEHEGERILTHEAMPLDDDQGSNLPAPKESTDRRGPPERGDI
jgi:cbb3-type cytochrome oxidase maturation protein